MSLGEHLEELRRRLIYALIGMAIAMLLATLVADKIIRLLTYPYATVMKEMGKDGDLAVLTVGGGVNIYFQVALIGGAILASPWIIYQFWMFVATGLYEREKRYVRRIVPFAAILFITGAIFFLGVVSFPLIRFFLNFNQWLGVKPLITLGDHLSFIAGLMFIFGSAFQTPLAIMVLLKLGIVSSETLSKYRRHVIIGILILSGILTPSPSPLDQLALAVPIWALYELGLLLGRLWLGKKDP
jgi:sec-independent protein translocase protein TatC